MFAITLVVCEHATCYIPGVRVSDLRFKIWGLGFSFLGWGLGFSLGQECGFMTVALGTRDELMRPRLVAACYRVDGSGSGSRVMGFQGLGFRVWGVGG